MSNICNYIDGNTASSLTCVSLTNAALLTPIERNN